MQTNHSVQRADQALGFPTRTVLSVSVQLLATMGGRLGQIRKHAAIWIRTAADYYAAAAAYEQLSALSDAELHRRGLSRDSLARDVEHACRTQEERR